MTTPTQRLIRLTEMRNMKMARSAHAYVRGSAVKFYEWLETTGAKQLPEGPAVWICGDCHVGNLGPLADKKGRGSVQIRDLDQTVIGNPAHDLIRLGLSLACAARGSDLPGVTTALILEQLLAGYEAALRGDFDSGASHRCSPPRIQRLLQQSLRQRWQHLSLERLDAVAPVFPLGDKLWALARKERSALIRLLKTPPLRGQLRR